MVKLFHFNNECILRKIKELKNGPESLIISNLRFRTHLEISPNAIIAILTLDKKMTQEEWSKILTKEKIRDRTEEYYGKFGLVSDHTGINSKNNKNNFQSGSNAFILLRKRFVLIEKDGETNQFYKKKISIFDEKNLGSFHQKIGQYVTIFLRERNPWRAWLSQKFSPNGSKIIGNNYKEIQEPFFDSKFNKKLIKNKKVLDFGCGNGYFSKKFAQSGAKVTGIDTSEDLICYAKNRYKLNFIYKENVSEIIKLISDKKFPKFDFIYFQDTILLLINDPLFEKLLQALKKILKKNGQIIAMEPNSTFWLASRYGTNENPVAIISEYNNQVFNVAPNPDKIINIFSRVGFGLIEYSHPKPHKRKYKDFSFTKEFPIWDFYRFRIFN